MNPLVASQIKWSIPLSVYHKPKLFGKPEWRPVTIDTKPDKVRPGRNSSSTPSSKARFTMITYNIWFDNIYQSTRYTAIADLIVRLSADIVCIQEAIVPFLRYLLANPGIQAEYGCIGGEAETLRDGVWYGCLILVRRSTLTVDEGVGELENMPLSRYRRRLLSTRVTGVRGQATEGIKGLRVGTAHLDSPGGEDLDAPKRARRAQLEYIVKRYQHDVDKTKAAVFCGDTNLARPGEDAAPAELGFKDAWTEAGMDGGIVTFDSFYPTTGPPNRLDRVLYLGDKIRSVQARLIGEETVWCEEARKEVHLSDHKGVMVTLEVDI